MDNDLLSFNFEKIKVGAGWEGMRKGDVIWVCTIPTFAFIDPACIMKNKEEC